MGKKKKIQNPTIIPGKRLEHTEESKSSPKFKHPVFCFKYLDKKYGLGNCTKDEKAALIEKLHYLSQLDWQTIQNSPRHGAGSEKIKQNSIKTGIPAHISKDVIFYSLRFSGRKPIVGYKSDFVFHIIWIDNRFEVYSH
ncbi:MAG: hypothetical protein GY754_26765 [bacterium]|nr:hypothetical protein [bacterium]